MPDRSGIEELMDHGAGRPSPEPVVSLYREAFATYGSRALWSRRPSFEPTLAQALVIARALRQEGDMGARAFAERIEDACRAAL